MSGISASTPASTVARLPTAVSPQNRRHAGSKVDTNAVILVFGLQAIANKSALSPARSTSTGERAQRATAGWVRGDDADSPLCP